MEIAGRGLTESIKEEGRRGETEKRSRYVRGLPAGALDERTSECSIVQVTPLSCLG